MKRILLAAAISKLMRLWLIFSVFILLLFLVQTIGGKYGDDSNKVWLWYVIQFLPCNLLILVGYFRHRRLALLTLSDTTLLLYRIVFWLSLLYLVAITLVILVQPFGNTIETTELKRLQSGDAGLYTFQGILIVTLIILVYTTEKRLSAIRAAETGDGLAGEPGVFISYNHADKEVAYKLKSMLEKESIPVVIDYEAMRAGEDIKTFIEKSVLNNRTTLSIVSTKSLLSGWVGMETVNTFFLQKFSKNKQFISCYLDDSFFDIRFTANAIESFNGQLNEVNEQIEKHNQLGIDTRDLNDQKSRLLSLRNNLDGIIERLRNSLCIDIRDEKLETNFPKIIHSIKPD
jgi:hypothetical protein